MSFDPIHLRGGGTSLLLISTPEGFPAYVHWGADLGALEADALAGYIALREPAVPTYGYDKTQWVPILPDALSGYSGRLALEGERAGNSHAVPRPAPRQWRATTRESAEGSSVELLGVDDVAGWQVTVTIGLTEHGVLHTRTVVRNVGPDALHLAAVRTVLPVGTAAVEALDLTGRWAHERVPQRHRINQALYERASRRGRPGHDSSLMLTVGSASFGFESGECWAVHVAWSGNHSTYVEQTPGGETHLGAGELLEPGEVVLEPGQEYTGPRVLAAYSGQGLNGVIAAMHSWLRAHEPTPPAARRIVLNTWEATYFDQRTERLVALAQRAAKLGIERFVLDDGWFRGRRSDNAGLGDWQIDTDVWPDGLSPLITAVREAGMDFGIWVEPEMVNPDSDLARRHPDWILGGGHDLPPLWRHQQVLNLQAPGAFEYLLECLDTLLAENDISFVKWDHNRDLTDPAHAGKPATHGQVLAFYRLLDELRQRHPGVEIESCASGGARIDAEVLTRTNRVWASDSIDPLERYRLQTWTSLVVPPEMLGSHVGSAIAHTSGRSSTIAYRAAAALLFHFGVECDINKLSEAEAEELAAWIALHKQVRKTRDRGRLVVGDHPDPALSITGLISEDQSEAWYVIATLDTPHAQPPRPVRLPGLAPDRSYRVSNRTPAHTQPRGDATHLWPPAGGLVATGRALSGAGVQLRATMPQCAEVLHVETI